MESVSYRLPGIRTFEATIILSGWPSQFPENGVGKMDDLPANVQDAVYTAMELKSKQLSLPLSIVQVNMGEDADVPVGTLGHFFLHIILSEVVTIETKGTRH